MVALARLASGGTRLQLVRRLEQHLGIDHASLDLIVSRLTSESQRSTIGFVFVQDRLRLGEPRLGRLDVGLRHLHHLEGQLDPLLVELDRRLLRPEILDQLGHEQGGQHVALFDLVADVDIPLLDIGCQLGINRRALVGFDEAWLADHADDRPDRRVDHLHGRGLRDAREVDLGLVAAARRRSGQPGARARTGGSRRSDRDSMCQTRWTHQ